MYAQYPDAEITQVEDYTKPYPKKYPDPEYDLWGSEFTLVNPEEFPILSYKDFEHSVTKEYFKDPMAAMLETMSRIGKGENCWFQIFVQPTGKAWQEHVREKAAELTAELVESRASDTRPFPMLHKGETDLVEAVYNKSKKNGFKCKIRIMYLAKKTNYNAKRVQYGMVGAMKQFGRDDSNGIKPLYSATGVTGHYLFKDFQKNLRKSALFVAYQNRSGSRGGPKFVLNVEELATIWHFPVSHAVRAPSLAQVSAKRGEAPGVLPLETEFEEEVPVEVEAAPQTTRDLRRARSARTTRQPRHDIGGGKAAHTHDTHAAPSDHDAHGDDSEHLPDAHEVPAVSRAPHGAPPPNLPVV
ncbi:MAG: hypothetical protein NT003_01185 [Candidatus Magasanikbacteria bacterium]|nr:hypothetical protein [Candidatus Magasanikbacteria bacterium]